MNNTAKMLLSNRLKLDRVMEVKSVSKAVGFYLGVLQPVWPVYVGLQQIQSVQTGRRGFHWLRWSRWEATGWGGWPSPWYGSPWRSFLTMVTLAHGSCLQKGGDLLSIYYQYCIHAEPAKHFVRIISNLTYKCIYCKQNERNAWLRAVSLDTETVRRVWFLFATAGAEGLCLSGLGSEGRG